MDATSIFKLKKIRIDYSYSELKVQPEPFI